MSTYHNWRLYVAYKDIAEVSDLINIASPNVFLININALPPLRFYEFDLLQQVCFSEKQEKVTILGVFSSKAPIKLGLSWEELIQLINARAREYDLLIFNPMYANNALFKNGFEQGSLVGHSKLSYICSRLGLNTVTEALTNPFCFSMCNYFLASLPILRDYIGFIKKWITRVDSVAEVDNEFRSAYFGSADYWKNPQLNYDNFFVERLLELFLNSYAGRYFYYLPNQAVIKKKFGSHSADVTKLFHSKLESHNTNRRVDNWSPARKLLLNDAERIRVLLSADDPI